MGFEQNGPRSIRKPALIFGAMGLLLAGSATMAQPVSSPGGAGAAPFRSTGSPKRDTLLRMMKPITLEFRDTRVEDVVRFVAEFTGAEIEPMWTDDRNPIGLDKDLTISLKANNVSALTLIERVLERAVGDTTGFSGNTWQLAEGGELQIGPKDRLGKFRRVEIYDINDLLMVLPDYTNAPEFDLNSVLQSGRGGGGQSPFQNTRTQNNEQQRPKEERAQDIINILTALVEPEQWPDGGGENATVRYYQGTLIINAPDFVHRGINGYPFWPSQGTVIGSAGGRRYVKLDLNTGVSKLQGFEPAEVSAVVGGRIIRSGDPPGPGGSNQPPAQQPRRR